MADLIDVMKALASQCGSAIYPSGTASASISGAGTTILIGWPAEDAIDASLRAGTVTVSIYAGKVVRNTTRFLDGYQQVGSTHTLAREVRRVSREFQITVWAPDPAKRDSTGSAIDLLLSGLRTLALPDGSQAFLRFARDWIDDVPQKELNYQRIVVYEVEHGTFQTETATVVTEIIATVSDGDGDTHTIITK